MGAGEECDGPCLGGAGCATLGYAAGELACTEDCAFDRSACHTCGDGVAEASEECDAPDLAGATCESAGIANGALRCGPDCALDLAGCAACGDGAVELNEQCDDGNADDADGCTAACTLTCIPETWTRDPTFVLDVGPPGSWDGAAVVPGSATNGLDMVPVAGLVWGCDISSSVGDWEGAVDQPAPVRVGSEVRVWFAGSECGSACGPGQQIGVLPGPAPVVLALDVGPPGAFDAASVSYPVVLSGSPTWHMWYGGSDGATWRIGHATGSCP